MMSLTLFLTLSTYTLNAQKLDWGLTVGGTSNDIGNSITADDSGNIYVTGNFMSTVDFDPGSGTVNLTSKGSFDVFICKYTNSGALIWARTIGSPGSISNDFGKAIAVNKNGDITVIGSFSGTIDINPGSGTASYTSAGFGDVFIIQLDRNGNYNWGGVIGGNSDDIAKGLTYDGDGNILLTGAFSGTADLDPGSGTNNVSVLGGNNIYVIRLLPNGSLDWVQTFGAGGDDNGNDILTDAQGNVYIAGGFSYTVDFDPGPATLNVTSNNNSWDIMILELDSDGNYVKMKYYGSKMYEVANALARDKNGNIYIAGYFRDTSTDIDPGSGVYYMNSNGGADVFVAKLDTGFNLVWAKGFGDSVEDWAYSVQCDDSGRVYTCGFFQGDPDFYPGDPRALKLNPNASQEIYMQCLDKDGNMLWSHAMGNSLGDYGNDIYVDKNSRLYGTGYYRTSIDVNPLHSATNTITAKGGIDMYLLKWSPFDPHFTDIAAVGCKSYTSPSGAYTWTKPGNYSDFLTAANGSDSILFVSLSFKNLDKTTTLNGTTLTATETGASYQWVNCSTGYSVVPGEIKINFTPKSSGSYAVIITKNGCIDTSGCTSVSVTNGLQSLHSMEVNVYPNPSSGSIYLQLQPETEGVSVVICDYLGQTICQRELNNDKTDYEFQLNKGIYMIRVMNAYGVISKNILIE